MSRKDKQERDWRISCYFHRVVRIPLGKVPVDGHVSSAHCDGCVGLLLSSRDFAQLSFGVLRLQQYIKCIRNAHPSSVIFDLKIGLAVRPNI